MQRRTQHVLPKSKKKYHKIQLKTENVSLRKFYLKVCMRMFMIRVIGLKWIFVVAAVDDIFFFSQIVEMGT